MDRSLAQDEPAAAAFSTAKIVIVVPGLGAGGTEHVVNLVANHWAENGLKVVIVTLEPPGSVAYYKFRPEIAITRLGVPPKRSSRWEAALLAARRLLRLRSELRREKPSFILSFLTRTNVLTLLAATGCGFPVVVSERNNPDLQPFGPVWTWLRRRLYPKAYGLVTMTEGALAYFSPAMRRRSWVIPNAVDLPQGWSNRRGGNLLAAVGRLTHQKGFDLLLEAFAKIHRSFPEWKLVIWGEGEDRAKLEEKRRDLGLDERVDLPGITKAPGQWVETADVFVLSSRYEGWGIVLLEAMAASLPVVSFDCEWGPRSMVTDGVDGLLVPNGDVEALAGALTSMLSDAKLRERLGARAAASAERYTPKRVLAEWDAVIRQALDDRNEGKSI
ncbi:glycosyltransferase family 4 protein [Rhizobium sp. TRM95111]|uniref:glycosyltransferase family 4 protein n=1 Tax=Rhizobium alarense TaxID=2846851 RepID=UPI001F1BDDAE|nr:glycosyltransferase family 4 protein [Rhizobium alarense]MCF3641696.1 glycosyltransferase family 4 protein [Rhizobium alarense]